MAGKKGILAGQAYVKAYLDDSAVSRGLKKLRSQFDGFAASLGKIGLKLFAAGGALGSLFAAPLKRAAMLEMLEADFTVLLGSVDKAKKLLMDFRDFAKETPLEFIDIAATGKQLLNWKLATEKNVIDVMRKIGDAAGGVPEKMEGIVRALGQMRATGRIQADEMNQLTEQGIPAWELLAKVLGTDTATAMQKVTDRAVDATKVVPVLINALGEFGNGRMAAQARTLAGRFSNLKDAFWEAVTPLGEALLPYAGKLLTIVSKLVDDIGGWIKANAVVAVKLTAVAAAVMGLGAAMVGASLAIRGASFAISGLAIAIRVALVPARLAVVLFNTLAQVFTGVLAFGARAAAAAIGTVSIALRLIAASAVATGATIRGFAATIAALAAAIRALSFVAKGTALTITVISGAMQLAKKITASTAVAFRVAAAAVGLLAVATRLASMAVVASAALVRLAGAAFATFGAIVNTTALAISGVGTVLMLLGNPIGGVLLALAAVGAALYYARGVSIDFGGALDWLKDRFGPLADQAMAAFSVIKDAIMANDWKTAASLLWSGLQAAFLRGKIELLKVWDDLTAGIRESLQQALAGALGKFVEFREEFKAVLEDIEAARQKAAAVVLRALGETDAANVADYEAGAAEIHAAGLRRGAATKGEKAITKSLAGSAKANVDREALRTQQEMEAAAAEKAFGAATESARAAVEAANAVQPPGEQPPSGPTSGDFLTDSEKKGRKKPSEINTAALAGSSDAVNAILKATHVFKKPPTPAEQKMIDLLTQMNESWEKNAILLGAGDEE